MLVSLALSVALSSSSGGLLAGRLPVGVRLLDAPTTAFGVVLGASAERQLNLEAMSHGELEMERLRLIDSQPSVVPGIVVASAGLVAFIVGYAVLEITGGTVGTLAGALLLVGGLAALVTGGIMLLVAIIRGASTSARIRRVEQRINTLLQQPSGVPLEGDAPPPPPPPPGVLRELPQPPQVLLATF